MPTKKKKEEVVETTPKKVTKSTKKVEEPIEEIKSSKATKSAKKNAEVVVATEPEPAPKAKASKKAPKAEEKIEQPKAEKTNKTAQKEAEPKAEVIVEQPKDKKKKSAKTAEEPKTEIKQEAKPKIIKDDALLEPINYEEEPSQTKRSSRKKTEKEEKPKAEEPKPAAKPIEKVVEKPKAAPTPAPAPAAQKPVAKKTEPKPVPVEPQAPKPDVRYSDEDLEMFKNVILEARSEALDELQMLYDRLEDLTNYDFAEESMIYSMHMAEQGSEAMEKEKTYAQIQRIKDYIKKLDEALLRIKDKTYGICRVCGILIAKERLLAVPITTLSASYKIHQRCPEDGIDKIEPIKE